MMRRRFMSANPLATPMYIEALEDGVCFSLVTAFNGNIEYSVDECNSWVSLDSEVLSESVLSGTKMYIKGSLTPAYGDTGVGRFTIKGKCKIGGSPASLMYYDDFMDWIQISSYNMYRSLFYGCSSIISASELLLPATTLADNCYNSMFSGCTSLQTAPELPATTLAADCYNSMFSGCSSLNYIKMLATDISATDCLYNWVSGVASSGTFVKNAAMTSIPFGVSGIPSGWTVKNNITPTECTSLSITADDVSGEATQTTIYYTAVVNGIDVSGNEVTGINITGKALSEEFPQNTSTTDTVTRTISYTYMGMTATTTITQGVWVNSVYTIDLNGQWQTSTVSNPDSNLYDGVYESFSNKGVHNTAARMYIDIVGYTEFSLYIRSYAESNWDYVMVSQLDQTIDNNTSYIDTTLVKAHTRGSQTSGTAIGNYKLVEFTGIDKGEHRITVLYCKDSSGSSGDDKGYLLIPKNQ